MKTTLVNPLQKLELAKLPCTYLAGVGPRLSLHLQKLNILSLQDLLFHLPTRYLDRTRIIPIANLRPGDHGVVEGTVMNVEVRKGRRTSLLVLVQDSTGAIVLRFFYFTYAQQQRLLSYKEKIRCFGEVRWGAHSLEIVHPEYQFINTDSIKPVEESLTPVYPLTEGLHQNSLRKLVDQTLALLAKGAVLTDYLPAEILNEFNLPDLISALRYVHRPPPDAPCALLEAKAHPAQQRLAYEELMAHQLSLRKLRHRVQTAYAYEIAEQAPLAQAFLQRLAFPLTSAQQRVIAEIKTDLAKNQPMLRLVQGDVGSGKTVVAALAILQTIANGYQAVLMAPTELLVDQHAANFKQWLQPLNIEVVSLTSRLKNSVRQQVLASINSGRAQLIIGTHALFQKEIEFAKLALMVIDEQHRFGVHQRLQLREKGKYELDASAIAPHHNDYSDPQRVALAKNVYPHQLVMTATPIPRTLAMMAYADLDCSVIDEMPPGRTPVETLLVSSQRRQEVIVHVQDACQRKQQAYWVCTLIEESEQLQCQAAEATMATLSSLLPTLTIALIHGRLKSAEKEQIMRQFHEGTIDLLIATTVIEVGVDVPNASLMIIENPERLGLAQLHQLRGRVGRGHKKSYCVLLYQHPLSQIAKERLAIFKNSTDGFVIAQKDLELRGPGEVLGIRQTGLMQFKVADLMRDRALLPAVQKSAEILLNNYPLQAELLIQRWISSNEYYGDV